MIHTHSAPLNQLLGILGLIALIFFIVGMHLLYDYLRRRSDR